MTDSSEKNRGTIDPVPIEKKALFRFSLYGFLKNQRYFEPFIILAFMEKGLSFFYIGLLIGFRQLCINIFEIPSGAVADLYGKRKSMILSFASYTISFVIFGLGTKFWQLFAAMFFFAIGEVFRTGTHKAIIFDYLKNRGQENLRTKIYGYTRSWSKIGSAVSVIIAAALVFWRGKYSYIFWLCAIPSSMNIINFLFYPPDTKIDKNKTTANHILRHTFQSLKQSWVNKKQRYLLIESGGFEGLFKIAKDYLQLVIKTAALSLPFLIDMPQKQRTAIMIGIIYTFIFLLSSLASRQTHLLVQWRRNEDKAAKLIWIASLIFYALMIPSLIGRFSAIAVAMFVCVYLLQNIWKPILISRLNACSDPEQTATTLSINSQVDSTVAMIIAPILGLAVDHLGLYAVGILGAAVSLLFCLRKKS